MFDNLYLLWSKQTRANLFYFNNTQIIYFSFNEKKESIIYQDDINYDLYDVVINLNVNEYFDIYKLIGNINWKYKVGIKSLFSNKFYNIEYTINQLGSTESAYQNIKLLLGYKWII